MNPASGPGPKIRWQLAELVVDPVRRVLLRNGEAVAVTPKAFSPSSSCAIFSTSVLSMPPEKATSTDCISAMRCRRRSSVPIRSSVVISALVSLWRHCPRPQAHSVAGAGIAWRRAAHLPL